jgi:hypothetical protein
MTATFKSKWTREEIGIIRRHFGTTAWKYVCAELLPGRSEAGIQAQARAMGLTRTESTSGRHEQPETRATIARDERILAIYDLIYRSEGISTRDVSLKIGCTESTALVDLNHLADGGLAEKRGQLWYWCKRDQRDEGADCARVVNVKSHRVMRKAAR